MPNWLKGWIRGQIITPRNVLTMSKSEEGDTFAFDERGAVRIYGLESQKILGKKGIAEIGRSSSPTAIWRPSSGNKVSSAKALDSYFGWTYTALNATADEVANTRFQLFKVDDEGEREEIKSHPILDLLDGVNDFQTGYEFKHTLTVHLKTTGNAYILLMKGGVPVKSYEDIPDSIWLLNPGATHILLNRSVFPYTIAGYKMVDDGREFTFKPEAVLQIKCPNPSDPYSGIGAVQGVAEWIDNDNNATEFLRRFFINGARINGILETDMTGPDALEELKISYETQYAGVENAHKTMALPKGVKFIANTQSFADMGLPELSDAGRDKILAGFRVSKTILGTAESDTNRATADTADYVFSKRTVKPLMELIVAFLNQFLVPRYDENVVLDFEDPVTEDRAAKMVEMAAAVGGQPVITVNEAREEYLGLPPVEGGDEIAKPVAMNAIGLSAKPKTTPKKAIGKKKSPVKTQFRRNAELRRNAADSLKAELAKKLDGLKKKSVFDMTDVEYEETVHKGVRERANGYKKQAMAKFRVVNDDQKVEVMKNLKKIVPKEGKTAKQKAVKPSDIFDLDKWVTLTVDLLTPVFASQFKDESEHAAAQVGKPDLNVFGTDQAQRAIRHAMGLMSDSYNSTVLAQLTSKINEGLQEGYGLDKMTDLVSDVYAFQDEYAAERVARTETVRIANTANKMAWEQSGNVKTVKWYTSGKDNVCAFCAAENGTVIPVDENFYDKGDTIEGNDGSTLSADYSAIGGPPLHPQCGCLIRPWEFKAMVSDIVKDAGDDDVNRAINEIEHA